MNIETFFDDKSIVYVLLVVTIFLSILILREMQINLMFSLERKWKIVKTYNDEFRIEEIGRARNRYVYFVKYENELVPIKNTNMKDKLKIGDILEIEIEDYKLQLSKETKKEFKFLSIISRS